MTRLKDLQHEVATILAGASALAGVPTIEHKGSDANEVALTDALEQKGCALVATIPFNGKLASQVAGTASPVGVVDVEISVLVRLDVIRNNPAKNAGALNKDIFDLISGSVQALLSHRGSNPNDVYKLAPEPLTLDTYDAGVWGYEISFIKRCVL